MIAVEKISMMSHAVARTAATIAEITIIVASG
jgi:hypothetical protein